ncbi:pyridoxal 5'-phosphate synthase glutaminase subunit PdxT [Gulosibacter sediminis]|uniref:pyridoxal 5'-phosphate synthase glutaminase subunit PdxT n=1 Tax=Gulosibacter sediminis TaxID=1729695 RepID=UPI0024A87A4B|nr:pyridoxal 5'-phosphate synthase glutaminase subunit PdxT [Gulosibacter sediminis]
MSPAPIIGVLALQGDVREHARMLEQLGVRVRLVRTPAELTEVDALVLPGGESSTIDKLSRSFEVAEPIRARIAEGMPVFGTCAGLILLADRITDAAPGQQTFGGLDVTVQRNAFGSQLDSFEAEVVSPIEGEQPATVAFIRAPIVVEVGERAEALASVTGDRVVAVRQGNLLGISFHPEVTGDTSWHRHFLELVEEAR